MFNLMYCGGDDEFKSEMFFELVQTPSKTAIMNGSQRLLSVLESMTIISSVVISEAILKDLGAIDDESDEQQLQELRLLYVSNTAAIKDFVVELSK